MLKKKHVELLFDNITRGVNYYKCLSFSYKKSNYPELDDDKIKKIRDDYYNISIWFEKMQVLLMVILEAPFEDGYNEEYDRCISYLMSWDVEGEITKHKKRMVGTGVPINEKIHGPYIYPSEFKEDKK
jgi:hypothetical protein